MALTKAIKDLIEEIKTKGDLTEEQIEEKLNKALGETHVPKNVFNEKTEAEKQAKAKITEYENQIKELQKSGNLTAEQKTKIDELTAKLAEQETKYQTELTTTKRGYALEQALLGAKARDVKSVLPHIDQTKLAWGEDHSLAGGLKEQLEALQKDKAFLFESEQEPQKVNKPSFGGPSGGTQLTGEAALQAQFASKLGIKTS